VFVKHMFGASRGTPIAESIAIGVKMYAVRVVASQCVAVRVLATKPTDEKRVGRNAQRALGPGWC
jgi:hypothetical protein